MNIALRVARTILLAYLVGCLSGCFMWLGPRYGPALPEHQGIEAPELLDDVHGTIIWVDRHEDDELLHVRDLQSGAQRTIELDGEPISVSGPDENGDVVFLETSGF